MAEFDVKIAKGLQEQISKLGNIDAVAPKMIEAAQPIMVKAIKRRAPVYKGIQFPGSGSWIEKGALRDSVTASKPKKTKSGAYIGTIVFKGTIGKFFDDDMKPPKEVPTALVATVLEYGKRENKKYKHPFIYPATKDCEQEVNEKMQEVFSEAMK